MNYRLFLNQIPHLCPAAAPFLFTPSQLKLAQGKEYQFNNLPLSLTHLSHRAPPNRDHPGGRHCPCPCPASQPMAAAVAARSRSCAEVGQPPSPLISSLPQPPLPRSPSFVLVAGDRIRPLHRRILLLDYWIRASLGRIWHGAALLHPAGLGAVVSFASSACSAPCAMASPSR